MTQITGNIENNGGNGPDSHILGLILFHAIFFSFLPNILVSYWNMIRSLIYTDRMQLIFQTKVSILLSILRCPLPIKIKTNQVEIEQWLPRFVFRTQTIWRGVIWFLCMLIYSAITWDSGAAIWKHCHVDVARILWIPD